MSDLDNAIQAINTAADRTEGTTEFIDNLSTYDENSSITNPNNGVTVPSIAKRVKTRTDELFEGAESDINQSVADAAKSASDAEAFALSLGYKGLWPDTDGSALKGDTYQTQVGGTPTGQYFTALQDTTVDPVGDDVNWRLINSATTIPTKTSENAQDFIDSFALKIFQSPTNGGLTEIQTRTVVGSEVYEVRKVSDDSFATIYSDAAGTTEIVQNGTSNVSGSDGVVEFFVADGDYYVEVSALSVGFSVGVTATDVATTDGRNVQERLDDLPSEVDAAGTAATLISQHNSDATAHPELSAFITAEADRAEVAADAAAIIGVTYEDVASGISATADGDYFSVVSPDDFGYLDLYKNESGVAVFKKTYPSSAYIKEVSERSLYSSKNLFDFGDFIDGTPDFWGSNAGSLTPSSVENKDIFTSAGVGSCVRADDSDTVQHVIYDNQESMKGKFVFFAMAAYRTDGVPASDPNNAIGVIEGTGSLEGNFNSFIVPIDDNSYYVYGYKQIVGDVDRIILGGSSTSGNYSLYSDFFVSTPEIVITDESAIGFFADYLVKRKSREQVLLKRIETDNKIIENENSIASLGLAISDIEESISDNENKDLASFQNLMKYGDFIGGTPELVGSSYSVQNVTVETAIANIGVERALKTESSGHAAYYHSEQLNGKYVFLAEIMYRSDGVKTSANAFLAQLQGGGFITDFNASVVNIDDNSYYVYGYAEMTQDVSRLRLGGYASTGSYTLCSAFSVHVSDEEITQDIADGLFKAYLNEQRIRPTLNSRFKIASENESNDSLGMLTLNESSSYGSVESKKYGAKITREFQPFRGKGGLFDIPSLNLTTDTIDGAIIANGTDNIAPIHVMNSVVGANHGYFYTRLKCTSHGKTSDDIGSVYTNGASEVVIMSIVSDDYINLSQRATNGAVQVGSYSHVSGGVNNGGLVLEESVISSQFYPCYQNYSLKVYVDDLLINERTGKWQFKDKVVLSESYEILEKNDIMEHIISTGNYNVSGKEGVVLVNNSYEFDLYGGCTIYADWLFMKSVPVYRIAGLQEQKTMAENYYIPKVKAYGDYDYAMIEPSNKTQLNGDETQTFTPDKYESADSIPDRVIGINGDHAIATGLLPVSSASASNRPINCEREALSITGSTAKIYHRVVAKNDHISEVGEHYSAIMYRNLMIKPDNGTAAYVVRTRGGDFLYFDWHNISETQVLDVPAEFAGREFDVVESRNATQSSDELLDSKMVVNIDSIDDYSYLVIKVKK